MMARIPLAIVLALASGCTSRLDWCDIRSSSCREDVYLAVLDARGDTWDTNSASPPSRVISVDEYRRELEAESASMTTWDTPWILLGLLGPSTTLPEAQIDDQVENTAAYYSSATGRITVIDHGAPIDLEDGVYVLAHELVHAVQDRGHGLHAFYEGTDSKDMAFARASLIEGEAVLYSNLVAFGVSGRDPQNATWTSYYDQWQAGTAEAVAAARARLDAALWLYVYPVGGRRVTSTHLAEGNIGVRELWAHPADRTIEVLTAYGATVPAPEELSCPAPMAPGPGVQGVHDRLGPIGLYALVMPWMYRAWYDGSDAAWSFVGGWRADGLWAYPPSSGATGTVAIYRVKLADDASAQTLESSILAYVDRNPSDARAWRVERVGREVTLAASDDLALLDTWTGWRCRSP